MDSFLCPNGTLFNQKYFVCDWWYNVDCAASESFFQLNEEIGKTDAASGGAGGFSGSSGGFSGGSGGFGGGDGTAYGAPSGGGGGRRDSGRDGVRQPPALYGTPGF